VLGFEINEIISNIPVEQLGQFSNMEHPPLKSDAHQKQFLHTMNFTHSLLTGSTTFVVFSMVELRDVIASLLYFLLCMKLPLSQSSSSYLPLAVSDQKFFSSKSNVWFLNIRSVLARRLLKDWKEEQNQKKR